MSFKYHRYKRVITFGRLRDNCIYCGTSGKPCSHDAGPINCEDDEVTMLQCPIWNNDLEPLVIFPNPNKKFGYAKYNQPTRNHDDVSEQETEQSSGDAKTFTDET